MSPDDVSATTGEETASFAYHGRVYQDRWHAGLLYASLIFCPTLAG